MNELQEFMNYLDLLRAQLTELHSIALSPAEPAMPAGELRRRSML